MFFIYGHSSQLKETEWKWRVCSGKMRQFFASIYIYIRVNILINKKKTYSSSLHLPSRILSTLCLILNPPMENIVNVQDMQKEEDDCVIFAFLYSPILSTITTKEEIAMSLVGGVAIENYDTFLKNIQNRLPPSSKMIVYIQ